MLRNLMLGKSNPMNCTTETFASNIIKSCLHGLPPCQYLRQISCVWHLLILSVIVWPPCSSSWVHRGGSPRRILLWSEPSCAPRRSSLWRLGNWRSWCGSAYQWWHRSSVRRHKRNYENMSDRHRLRISKCDYLRRGEGVMVGWWQDGGARTGTEPIMSHCF